MSVIKSAYLHKRILITGGGGYVASALIAALRDTPCKITRILRKPAPPEAPAASDMTDIIGDIRDDALWPRLLKAVDVIFHLAAQTSVYVAATDACADFDINARPILALLETCRSMRVNPALIFAGTATQYGCPQTLPVNESHPDSPITLYDLHKLMAEKYLKFYAREGHVQGATLRLPNIYGPGPASSAPDRGILNMMIRRALRGESLTVYGEGNYMRDYLYLDDLVDALLRAGTHASALSGQHFVLGTGEGHTLAEAIHLVADCAAKRTGLRVPVRHIETPPGLSSIECRNFIGEATCFTRMTSWKPTVTLSAGIDRTIAAFEAEAGDQAAKLEATA